MFDYDQLALSSDIDYHHMYRLRRSTFIPRPDCVYPSSEYPGAPACIALAPTLSPALSHRRCLVGVPCLLP